MNDQNDESQNYALMVLAGLIALVIAGVLMLAARSGHGGTAKGPSATTTAVAAAIAGEPEGRVFFASGSDALPADSSEVLVKVADAARAATGKVVLISGFHDASGDPAHNADLALRRARAVQHALEANGVAADHLILDKPSVTTGDGDAREARRVELRVR